MRPYAAMIIVLGLVVAGCLQDAEEPTTPAEGERGSLNALPLAADAGGSSGVTDAQVAAAWNDDGTLDLVVPLDVVLFGFDAEAAKQLQDRFAVPYGPQHITVSLARTFGIGGSNDESTPDTPGLQQVQVQVHVAPQQEVEAYRAAVMDSDGWDGNAAEAWMDGRLAAWGLDDGPLPALVLVHGGDEGHLYRIDFQNGHWETSRAMGGSSDGLLMDLAAAVDPYAGEERPYMTPTAEDDVDALEEAIQDAVRFRLLQGPIYPLPLPACHAVTLVYAVYVGSEAGAFSSITADEALNETLLHDSFVELTNETVHLDVVRLDLPVDDPALWALLRPSAGDHVAMGLASTVSRESAREWIEQNWETYHVDHEGCEEYLSLLVFSDAAEAFAYGIAEYDPGSSHRYSFSQVPEMFRGMYEPGLAPTPICCKSDSVDRFEFVNMLFSHETGHLFGQAHPHNAIDRTDDNTRWTFSTTRTVMSYLVDERDVSFGTIDQVNWHRNRALYYAEALQAEGLRDAAIGEGFLNRLAEGDWQGANGVAQGLLGHA
ncbi:MAG: hypothetical protein ACPGQL_09035 [Thermoplasmatota archaeon]